MPKNQRPSFMKRQKEQQRKAKADQKREARNARRRGLPAEDDTAAPEVEAVQNDVEPENEEQKLTGS
jgi:hypothetical protein